MDTQELLRREGRTNIENWSRQRAQALYLGETVLCRVLGKYLMYALPHDRSLMPHLAFDGYWEIWITMAIAEYIKPGMTCIDVGANIGYYSVLLADWVGPSGRVIAIEPERLNLLALRANLEHCGWATVEPLAVSDQQGSAMLQVYSHHTGSHTLGEIDPKWGTSPGQQIETTTLDYLAANLSHVDFVKIDVEGHERQVWRGMQELLAKNPGVQIAVEWTPQSDRQGEFEEMVRSSGLQIREIGTDGKLRPLSKLDPSGDWKMLWLKR